MKSVIIKENDAGQRLDKFLTKTYKALPKSLLYKAIRTKNIKINRKRAEISTVLQCGDVLDIYINDELLDDTPRYDFMSAPPLLDIVFEDENILLLNKKQGVLTHPDKENYSDTLLFRIQHYLFQSGEYDPAVEHSFVPALANRIDRNTGGIVIACKNAESLRVMNEKIRNRELDKFYYCLVHGTPKPKSATLSAYLIKNEDKNKVFISEKQGAGTLEIITKYTVLASKDNISLLEIQLITGRTHQIRAHMAYIGHPLLGDGKYGRLGEDKRLGFRHQALYCYKINFNFSSPAGVLDYLNGKEFSINDVWFKDEFFSSEKGFT